MELDLNPLVDEHRPQNMNEYSIHDREPVYHLLGVWEVLLVENEQKLHKELLELLVVVHISHFLRIFSEEDLEFGM
mgnify:CR=1 FL=1